MKEKMIHILFYNKKEDQVRKDFELILKGYNFKKYDKGECGIHMGILMNHTQISRLMKKIQSVLSNKKSQSYKKNVQNNKNI